MGLSLERIGSFLKKMKLFLKKKKWAKAHLSQRVTLESF